MEKCIKKNLVIGKSSQLAQYWPKENTIFISSRNVDVNNLKKEEWNNIYFSFAEQRTYLKESREFYEEVNVNYTIDLIKELRESCERLFIYSTSELWNLQNGPIDLKTKFFCNAYESGYVSSKLLMTKKILDLNYSNVFILYPFNFNSIYRDNKFLFGKVFDSIINEKEIIIGNVNFYRELLHPRFVVQESLNAKNHKIIGSGRLIHVGDFIRDLYEYLFMDYATFVEEIKGSEEESKPIFYLKSKECLYSYNQLFIDTINDIVNNKEID